MPKQSLQEKNLQSQATKIMSQALKRKRRSTDKSEDAENIHPPSKIPALSKHVVVDESCCTSEETDASDYPSPLKDQIEPESWSDLRNMTCFMTPSTSGQSKREPLPAFNWANGSKVWSIMCYKDQKTLKDRDPELFTRHRTLQPRMRAILLDWLIEVCEVYKLHRETYYLAMDFIDRYLSTHDNVPKNQLQLMGITCLFIAAKCEEIYPPKIAEFAYVTDGACTEEEILGKEIIILKGLKWNLSPITAPAWLNIFMQVENGDWTKPDTFIYPQYGGLQYVQAAQILDLATMDSGSLRFPYSHLAAAAVYHTKGRECALQVSSLSWDKLAPCVKYLSPFASTIIDEGGHLLLRNTNPTVETHTGSGLRATVPNIVLDESHRIQTHVVSLTMLEKAQQRLAEQCTDNGTFLDSIGSPNQSVILTPPSSDQKQSSPYYRVNS